jgi:ComF family protein
MLEDLLALVAPPACAVCGHACDLGRRLCERCELGLHNLEPVRSSVPGLDEIWSAAPYEGAARHLVAALKFGSRIVLAEEAAALIVEGAPADFLDGGIVPVPPAPLRRRRRGFDAAEAIAIALTRVTGMPLAPCLARTQGRRQVGRRRAERLADPPSVRAVSPVPMQALLVDDVTTTGATLAACAQALRAAGTTRVTAITLAASRPAHPLA